LLYDFERAKNLGADVFDAITTQLAKNTSAELCIIMKVNKRGWETKSVSNSRLANKLSTAKLKDIAEETILSPQHGTTWFELIPTPSVFVSHNYSA